MDSHPDMERVIGFVQQLGHSIGAVHAKIAEMETRQIKMDYKLDQILSHLCSSPPPSVPPSLATPPPPSPASSAPVAPSCAAPVHAPSPAIAVHGATSSQPGASPAAGVTCSMASSSTTPHAPLEQFLNYETKAKMAARLFLDCIENHGNVPTCKYAAIARPL